MIRTASNVVLVLAIVATGALVSVSPSFASQISWELYAAPCPDAVSDLAVSCGDFGEFHFGVQSSSCTPVASGSEIPAPYPGPGVQAESYNVTMNQGLAGAVLDHRAWTDRLGASLGPSGPARPWIAVVDWQDLHGVAVASLAYLLAGNDMAIESYYLDDPALAPLGSTVGDQHLLAKVCEVVEDFDRADSGLAALNLSLGRLPRSMDPGPGGCDRGRLSCQIKQVLGHLVARDVPVVAAAGNHQETLFPGNLGETIAVGGLDVGGYLVDGRYEPTWETPPEVDGLMPGNALCAFGMAIPSGASMSSAMFSGWLVSLLREMPEVDPYGAGWWIPRWSQELGCAVLTQGTTLYPVCNPRVGLVLQGIASGSSSGCWDVVGSEVAWAPPPGPPVEQPDVSNLDRWVATTLRPAPEEDPCIPCSDEEIIVLGPSSDLLLNLTRSQPLSSEVLLDSLYLRVGEAFYPIDLTAADLERMARGELEGLNLSSVRDLLSANSHPSLHYVFKMDSAVDCEVSSDQCFWHSTPIYVSSE